MGKLQKQSGPIKSVVDKWGLPETGFIRQKKLIPDVIPFSHATLWRKVKSGDFPSPVKLSQRITAWKVEDVRKWLEKNT